MADWVLAIVWIGASAEWIAPDWYESYDECIEAGVLLADAAVSISCARAADPTTVSSEKP